MAALIIPVWILAIVGVVRITQNAIQLRMMMERNLDKYMDKALDEYMKSLHKTEDIDSILRDCAKDLGLGDIYEQRIKEEE